MHQFLIILAIILCGIALRSFSGAIVKKAGALCYLASIGVATYFLSGSITLGIAASLSWLFLPWIELLTRIRSMRVPLNNKLKHSSSPCFTQFPESEETISKLEADGFEHASEAHWTWGDSSHYYSFYWHPEYKIIASVCFCSQKHVTFSFLTLSSQDNDGTLWRTTNYPFSQNLKSPPHIRWNSVSCKTKCLVKIRETHMQFVKKTGTPHTELRIPDPDTIESDVEKETRLQIDFNLKHGIIRSFPKNTFGYSIKGLFYLWAQVIRDMIRFF